jgi:hypothetical protein
MSDGALLTTETPGLVCVSCAHAMNRTTGDGKLEPGDFTLCIRCGALNVFDDDLRLRKPTRKEAREANAMGEMQDMQAAIMAVQAAVRKVN